METSADNAQTAIRVRGSNKCSYHYEKEVVYYCEKCDDLACAHCVVQEHKGHNLETLTNVIPTAKVKLQDYINQIEQTDLLRLKGKLDSADNVLSKTKEYYQKQINEIKDRNETLKNELDKITETLVKACLDIEQKSSEDILSHMRGLQSEIDTLSSQIQEFKETLRSGSDIHVFDAVLGIPSESKDLPTPVVSTSEFNPVKFSSQNIQQLCGKLDISINDQPRKCIVVSEFTPYKDHVGKSIHLSGKDEVLLSFYNLPNERYSERMLVIDTKGTTIRTLNFLRTCTCVTDFCVSPSTGYIWICNGNNVFEIIGDKSTMKFTTDTLSQCICVTRDDHIIIGHPEKIIKYTQGGHVISETSNPQIMIRPYHLSECPCTSNLAVVFLGRKKKGGDDSPFVAILDRQLQLLHTYTGHGQGNHVFPTDVCYSSAGELVIVDKNNRSVILTTGTGKYLRTLYIHENSEPRAVCVRGSEILLSLMNEHFQVITNT